MQCTHIMADGSGAGATHAKLQSDHQQQQHTNTQISTGRLPFLPHYQQWKNTEGNTVYAVSKKKQTWLPWLSTKSTICCHLEYILQEIPGWECGSLSSRWRCTWSRSRTGVSWSSSWRCHTSTASRCSTRCNITVTPQYPTSLQCSQIGGMGTN